MTALIREFLRTTPYVNFVVIGEVLFFSIFVLSLFWVFRSGGKGFYDKLSNLPLENGAGHDAK